MKNYLKLPLPTTASWFRLPERVKALEDTIVSYKTYTAILTQTSDSPPSSIVLENTLDVSTLFQYVSPGNYILNFDKSLFQSPNSYVTITGNGYSNTDVLLIQAIPVFFNVVAITSTSNFEPSDDIIGDSGSPCILEVRIYN